MVALRSTLYLAFLFLSIALFSIPFSTLGWFLPYKWLSRSGRAWGRANLWALDRICALRIRVTGLENLPQRPCIVLCKHQSAWETIALRAILPPEHTWVLKRELLWVPFFGWGIAPFRPIAIDRRAGRQAVRQLLKEGAKWLSLGRWVVIFPEGTRVAPGQRRRYGVGGALLAEKTGASIVPVAHNAGVFWRRRDYRKYPGVVDVVIGEELAAAGRNASDLNKIAEAWIESTVSSLPQTR